MVEGHTDRMEEAASAAETGRRLMEEHGVVMGQAECHSLQAERLLHVGHEDLWMAAEHLVEGRGPALAVSDDEEVRQPERGRTCDSGVIVAPQSPVRRTGSAGVAAHAAPVPEVPASSDATR